MDKFESMSPAVREMALQMPGMVPPAGIKSNLVDPPNGNKGVIGLLTVCIALTVSFAFMRFYARTFIQKKWHLEDCMHPPVLGLSFHTNPPPDLGFAALVRPLRTRSVSHGLFLMHTLVRAPMLAVSGSSYLASTRAVSWFTSGIFASKISWTSFT